MLHLTNGDGAVEGIRATGVDGDLLVWRDVLHEGPVPAGAAEGELREIRAGFLARCGWAEREEALEDLARRDARLERAVRRDEAIVLWFERDLYDQLQLVQVLDRLFALGAGPRATLVETEQPLGLIEPGELVAAYARGRAVEAGMLELGRLAWRAFRADDPREIEAVLAGGLSALPALGAALERHLEQFPGVGDGLSRSERQALAALADGPLAFPALFERAQRDEPRRFLGDVVLRWYLTELARPPAPLVAAAEEGEAWSLTERGRRVLAGEEDRLASGRFDRWLGGVRVLAPRRIWRWDRGARRIVAPA